jgi:uncharacterized integral membrane protein (TIGR00698 family)
MLNIIFLIGLAAAASSYLSPPVALALGILFGLCFAHPFPKQAKTVSKWLLQGAVVGLGFRMDLEQVIRAGRSGFVYTLLGISFALLLGTTLGRLLSVQRKSSLLISAGTAICGGSAIAALGPVIEAGEEQMAVSLATVFVLNAVALFIFPGIGTALGLSQSQFGLWAALAIHDTSSVVGAAAKYGAVALVVATTVKLARALWIVPLTLAAAGLYRRGATPAAADGPGPAPGPRPAVTPRPKIQWPWFIALFCLAAVVNTYMPGGAPVYSVLSSAAKIALTVTLYLIGSGISRASLRQVGPRPLLQGVLLWLVVGLSSLWLIRANWIAL